MSNFDHLCYAGIPMGISVRKQFGHEYIYRVRRGNGFANSKKGKRYQDKFLYFVPLSINNLPARPYRANFRAAVDYWQNILTVDEKKEYNKRAEPGRVMSGYNLFLRKALSGEYSMFVDRGDPINYDFIHTALTKDGTWQVLNLTSLIPDTARAVLLKTRVDADTAGKRIRFRKTGNTYEINTFTCAVDAAGIVSRHCPIVPTGGYKTIEYNADLATWATLTISVMGWWT